MRVLLATTNAAKRRRLRQMLRVQGVAATSPRGLGPEPVFDEPENGVPESARAKAAAWARHYGLPALATDGGLVVPSLGDQWDPARTRRAAGAGVDDAQRAAHLLALMRNLKGAERYGSWVEAAALAAPSGEVLGQWEARSRPWHIAHTYEPRGLPRGFWVPGLLEMPDGRRFGNLSPRERSQLESHWPELGRAVRRTISELLGKAD